MGSSLVRDPAGRRLTQAAALGMAGHVVYELANGVGLPLASVIGPARASALWSAGTTVVLRRARRRPGPDDRVLATVNGFAVAAVVAHFAAWPKAPALFGLPWLAECEGLGPDLMPPYNVILYVTGGAAVGGLLHESRGRRVLGVLVGAGAVPVVMAGQRWEHRRLLGIAANRPRWWNRRLQP
jgi:hypothetical protein